jgi:hypothetical protein
MPFLSKRFICALFVSGMLLSGCGTAAPSAPRDYKVPENATTGLVVLSLTQPLPGMQLMYRELKDGKAGRLPAEVEPIVDGETMLYPLLLPAGEYEFFRWTAPASGYRSTTPFSIRFRSTPGKVTYIGDLHMAVELQTGTYRFLPRDNRRRRIALFLKHYPNVREDQVETRPMEYQGDELRFEKGTW